MDPCSACILLPDGGADVDPSLEVVLVTEALARCPFLLVFTERVGEGDWTFLLFLKLSLPPSGWTVAWPSSSSSTRKSESSSAMSWRCGEGWRGLGGLSRGGAGGDGGAGLPSGALHQGKQHFQAPTSVATCALPLTRITPYHLLPLVVCGGGEGDADGGAWKTRRRSPYRLSHIDCQAAAHGFSHLG